jgi:hypothetical protein
MSDELDNIDAFHAKETERKLPLGWLLLFLGLIVWGIYYYVAYSPHISGWTQEKAYQQEMSRK